jgi:3'-5' exoribonuclease
MAPEQQTMVAVSALRPGQDVFGVFACTRKDRLKTRTGSPYLALELRDRTGTLPARAFQNADALAGRFERGDVVWVRGRVERFREELVLELVDIARADDVDPGRFLPTAYRDLDELDGFLEHLVGDALTIADLYLIPQLYSGRRFNVDLSLFPKLLLVEAACAALPAFIEAHPDVQPDAPGASKS